MIKNKKKYLLRKVKKFWCVFTLGFIFTLSSPLCHSQAWAGVLSSSRAIDWSKAGLPATLPDGETTANPWTPPIRNTICQTLGAGASASTISAAIVSCTSTSSGSVVILPAGTSTLSSELDLYGQNVTLRGAGPQQTFINLNGQNLFIGR